MKKDVITPNKAESTEFKIIKPCKYTNNSNNCFPQFIQNELSENNDYKKTSISFIPENSHSRKIPSIPLSPGIHQLNIMKIQTPEKNN